MPSEGNVTKADLARQIADNVGLTRSATQAVIDGFLAAVVLALEEQKSVQLRGFGTFTVKSRAPRVGRNPRTGESVPVPSRPVPVFRPCRDLRMAVEQAAADGSE
jgi:DNA-binding protein HU-beta